MARCVIRAGSKENAVTELPEPLTPPECDLRDFSWMPLDVIRLRDSSLSARATGEEFRAAVLLWCASWHQSPAASLPSDDIELAALCGFGRALSEWERVRDGALRGWVQCADGRLYHPIVAEKAREAWENKLAQQARTAAARAARAAKRNDNPCQPPPSPTAAETATSGTTETATENVASSVTENVTGSNRPDQTRPDQRKKERKNTPPPPHAPTTGLSAGGRRGERDPDRPSPAEVLMAVEAAFVDFWQAYPRKVGKGAARRAYLAALRKPDVTPDRILRAVRSQRFDDREKFIPHPATWLNGERWADEGMTGDPVLRAAGLNSDGSLADAPHDPDWALLTKGSA